MVAFPRQTRLTLCGSDASFPHGLGPSAFTSPSPELHSLHFNSSHRQSSINFGTSPLLVRDPPLANVLHFAFCTQSQSSGCVTSRALGLLREHPVCRHAFFSGRGTPKAEGKIMGTPMVLSNVWLEIMVFDMVSDMVSLSVRVVVRHHVYFFNMATCRF